MKNVFRQKKRLISFITMLALSITQTAVAVPASAAAFPEVPLQVPAAFELVIPPELGTVQSLASGTGPALVHLQTAHGNYQAQKKIQAILHHLKDRYGFKELFLEGSPYELEPEFIRFFPGDSGLTRRVADALSRQALLKGAELFLIEEKDARGHGIEDLETYKRNVEDFRGVLREKKRAQKFLSALEMQIDRLSSPYLNKNLRDFLKELDAFEASPLALERWLRYLKAQAGQVLELDLADPARQIDWPMLLRYFKLKDIERRFEPQAYAAEKEKFLNAAGEVPEETLVQIRRLLDAPLGEQELPDPQTGLIFESLIAYLPPNFAFQTYPQTALFITHLILQSELKGVRLMAEMRLLEDKIGAKLAQNETERKLVALFKDYRLLKKLFALELTPEDYQRLGEREHDFKPAHVAARFVEINRAGRVRALRETPTEDLDRLFAKALEFYAGVKARDGKMLQKLEEQLKVLGTTKAVVITGGFHARPFEDYFRQRGFNYALVAPKITRTGGKEKYEDVMLQSRLPAATLESIFQALPYRKIRAAGFNPRHFARAFAAETRRAGSRLSAQKLAARLNASRQLSQYPSGFAVQAARSEIRQDENKPSVQEMFKTRQSFQARATAKDAIANQTFTNVLDFLEGRMPEFEKEAALKNLARRVPAKKIPGPAAAHLRGVLKTLTMPLILKTLREKINAGKVIQLTVPDSVYRNYLGDYADLNQLAWAGADGNFYISNRFFQYLKELRKNNPQRVKEVVAAILVRLAVFDLLAGQLSEEAVHSEGLHQALEKFSAVFERAVSGGSILDPEKSAAADMAQMFLYQERFSAAPMPEQVLRSLRTGVSTAEKLMGFFQESLREKVVLPYYENRQIYQKRRNESAGMREKREGFIRAFDDLRRKYRAEILRTDESQELSTERLSYLSERVLQGIERLGPQALQERITRYHARYAEILKRMARYAGDETKQDRLARLNESARDLLSRLIFLEMQPSRIDALMRKGDLLPDSANYKTLDARFRALRYHLRAYERELLWLRVREAGRREVTAYVVGADWESGVGAYLLAPEFFARERGGEIVYPKFLTQGTGRVREEAYRAVQDQVKKLAKGAVEREMIRYRHQRLYLQDSMQEFLKPYWEEFDGFKDFMIERLRGEGAFAEHAVGEITLDRAVDALIRGPVHEEGLTGALLDDFQQFLLDSAGSETLRVAIEERFQFSLRPDVDQVSAVIEGNTYKSIFDLLRSYNHTLSSYAEANLTAYDMLGFVDDAINRLRALTRREFAQLPGAETMEKAAREDIDADLKRVRAWSDKGIKPSRRVVGGDLAAALLAIQFQDLGLLRKAMALARADTLRYIRENMRISKFIALKAMGMRDFVRRPVQVLLKSARVSEAVRVLSDLKDRQLPPRFTDPGYQRARKRLWRVMKALERMDGRTLLQKEGVEADELRKRYVRQLVELELIIYDVIHKRTSDEEFEKLLPDLRADIESLLLSGRTLDQTTFTPQVLRELHERVLGRPSKATRSEMRRERSPGTIRDGTRRSRSEMRTQTEQEERFEELLSAARSFAADFAVAPATVGERLRSALSNGKPKEAKKKNLTILAGFGFLPEEYRAWLTSEIPSPPAQPLHLTQEQLSQPAYKIRETLEDGSFRDSEVALDGLAQYGQPEFDLEPFYDANTNSYGFEIYGADRRSFGALILRSQGKILPQPVQWQPKIASSRPADTDESESPAFDREKRAGRSSSPVTIRAAIFERLTALVFHAVSQGQAFYRSGFALEPLIPGYIFPDLVWDGTIYDAKLGADLEDIGKTLIKYSHLKQIHAGYFKADSPVTIVVLDKTATQDFQLQGYVRGTDFRFISLEELMQEHGFQNAEFQTLLDALHRNGQSLDELKRILRDLSAQVKQAAIPGGKAIENGHVRRRLSSEELITLVRTEPGQLLVWVRETLGRVKNHLIRPQYINEHSARLAKQILSLNNALPDAGWIAANLAEHEKVFAELSANMAELSEILSHILPAGIYSAETLEPARPVRRTVPPVAAAPVPSPQTAEVVSAVPVVPSEPVPVSPAPVVSVAAPAVISPENLPDHSGAEIEDIAGNSLYIPSAQQMPAVLPLTFSDSDMEPEDFLSALPGRLGEVAADAVLLRVYPREDARPAVWRDIGFSPLVDLKVVLNERLEHKKNYALELNADGTRLTIRLFQPLAIPGAAESFDAWVFSAPSKNIEQVSPRFQHLLLQTLSAQKPQSAAALKPRDIRDFKENFLSHWEKGHLILENAPAVPYGLADQSGKTTLESWTGAMPRVTTEDQVVELERQAKVRHAREAEVLRDEILKGLIREITPDLADAKENLLSLASLGIAVGTETQPRFRFNVRESQALGQRIGNLSAQKIAEEALASGKSSTALVEEARLILKQKFEALADELEHIPFEESPAALPDAVPVSGTDLLDSSLADMRVRNSDDALAPLNPSELAQFILDYYLLYDLEVPESVLSPLEDAFGDFGKKINRFFPKASDKNGKYLQNFPAFMKRLNEIKTRRFTYKDVLEMSRFKIEIERALRDMMGKRPLSASDVAKVENAWEKVREQFKAILDEYGFKILVFTSDLLKGHDNALIAGFFNAEGDLYVATRQAGIFINLSNSDDIKDLSAMAAGNSKVEQMLAYFPKPVRMVLIPEKRFSAASPADVYLFQGAVSSQETLQFQSRLDPLLGAEIGPGVFVVEHAVMMALREVYPGEGQFPAVFDRGSYERFLQALKKRDENLYARLDKSEAFWKRLNVLFGTPNASMNSSREIDVWNFEDILRMAFTPALDELPVDDRQYLASGIGHLMSTDPRLTFLDSYEVRKHKIPPQEFARFEKLFQAMLKRQQEWLPVLEANYEKRFGKPGFKSRLDPALGAEIGPGILLFLPEVLQAVMKVSGVSSNLSTALKPLDPAQYQQLLEELQSFSAIYDKLEPSEAGRLKLNRVLDVNVSFFLDNLDSDSMRKLKASGGLPKNFEAVMLPAAANTLKPEDFALLARHTGALPMEEMQRLFDSRQARREKFAPEVLAELEPLVQHVNRVRERLKPVMEENFLKALASRSAQDEASTRDGTRRSRSEMRLPLAPEITTAFRVYREQLLPLRLEAYGTRELAALLSGLLHRPVYSERAGILEAHAESALAARLGRGAVTVTPAGKQQQLSQMSAEGRVLLDSVWMEKLIQKSPRALYVLLTALDQFQSGHAHTQPLIAVSGKDSLLEEIARALQKSTSGLDAEEKAEARHFLEPGRLRQLVQILSPEKIPQYIREQDYGVATLSAAGSPWLAELPLGAQFLLDPSQVAGEDLMALAFLIPSLLKAAQEVRGIEGAALQKAALIRNLQQIVWGAVPPQAGGLGFAIRLSAYIENVLIQQRLVDLSA